MSRLPPDREVAEQLARVRADVLEATHRVRSPRRSTRYRVTRNLLAGGVVVGALTGGAIAVATAPSQLIQTFTSCYAAADLAAAHHDVVMPATGDPVETCAFIWQSGQLGQGGDVGDPNEMDFPVPELAACEQRNGVAAVFPREGAGSDQGLCEALGLAVWDSD